MSLFPFFKKKDFFSEEEKERIVTAIRSMEQQTSGEIRIFVESKNPFVQIKNGKNRTPQWCVAVHRYQA
jgi:uncharacterized membrane protein